MSADETDDEWAARMDAGLVAMLRSPPSTYVRITSRKMTSVPITLTGDDTPARGREALLVAPPADERKAGRPPLPPEQRRDHTLRVRCDDALADAVEEAARAEGITVGAWIRRTLERAVAKK